MAEYRPLPVPDYATGARSSAQKTSDNLSRLLQQRQINANRRADNAQELSQGIQKLVNLSPTVAGLYKEQQLKADQERQANYQQTIEEKGYTSENLKVYKENEEKIKQEGKRIDQLELSSQQVEFRAFVNGLPNSRDQVFLDRYFASQDMQNMGINYSQSLPEGFDNFSLAARQNFFDSWKKKYLADTTLGKLNAIERDRIKLYETMNNMFHESNKKAAVYQLQLNKEKRTKISNQNIDTAINLKNNTAGRLIVDWIDTQHNKYGADRSIYKNLEYQKLLVGIDNDTFTREEIDLLLDNETGLDEFKTLKDYFGKEKVEELYEAIDKRNYTIWEESQEKNKQINQQKETKILNEITTTEGITTDDQKAILDVAIYELSETGYNPEKLEKLRDNLDKGTPEITADDRELTKDYEDGLLTLDKVKATNNAYLIKKWTPFAEKQEAGRKTESYKNMRKSIEQVFKGDTNFIIGGELSPAAQGIVNKLQRDFDREYAKLDPNDPEAATKVATMITTDFKLKGGGSTDETGLYSFNTKTGRFENYLKSIGANFSENDIRKMNARNIINPLIKQGHSKQKIINQDGLLLNEDQLEIVEEEYEENGTWNSDITDISKELNVPPWIIYSGQGGKKIKETDAAKTWKKDLSPKAKVSIIRDPSESTYTSIAYELSTKGIYDVDLNMALFGMSDIPVRAGFNLN